MDNFIKLSKEVCEEIEKILSQKEASDFIQSTKEATDEDSGTFEVIISTSDKDRHGEIVDINGWETERYMRNPIVLWGHDYHQLPIGVCDELRIEGNKLIAKGRFAPMEANPFAQQVRKLYDAKMLRATSVGFIAREMQGNVITRAELLEFSFVGVPANAEALSLRQIKDLGIDAEMLKSKGIELKDEAPEAEILPEAKVTEENDQKPEVEENKAPEAEITPENPSAGEEGAGEAPSGEVIEKAGRKISAKNRQTIQIAIDALKSATVALEDLLSMDEEDDDELEGTGGNDNPEKKVDSEINPIEGKAIDDWLAMRKVLRIVNNVTSKSLEEINNNLKK